MYQPKIEVRFQALTDEQIQELAKEEWTKFDHDHHITFSKDHYTLAIYVDNELAGYHHITITGGRCHLKQMIIKEDFQNKGFEDKMLQFLDIFCRQKNCHKIMIKTTANNNIIPVLKENGYEPEAILKDDICKLDWMILMKLL